MPMEQNGLAKLLEEMGEASQIAGKLIGYPDLQTNRTKLHPDGNNLRIRFQEELGDVLAAAMFTVKKLNLDEDFVMSRAGTKLALFEKWDRE